MTEKIKANNIKYYFLREEVMIKMDKSVNFSTEIMAGFTTFLTMAYIIFVNPQILSAAGMDKTALIGVTCIVTGIITILTGLLTDTPIAMAPGMGLNAYFTYTLVINQKVSWEIALGIVFLSGLLFLILTLVGIREKIVEAIPSELLNAIAVGIGIFIAFIGLQNMKLIVGNPETLVTTGKIGTTTLISLFTLFLIVILYIKRVKGALLIGIIAATIVSVLMGYTKLPSRFISFDLNISPVFAKLNIKDALKLSLLAPIFSLMFVDMFDSIGSLLALGKEANLIDKEGKMKKITPLLTIDAAATMFGAFMGTSTTTTYIESAAGIESGGRSGWTSITTGILFLAALIFVPILSIVPSFATAPALIMVGFLMMKNIKNIDFQNLEVGFPSFVIIIMIGLSYSISTGLAFGFLSYTFIKIVRGKFKDITPTMWLIAVLSILFLVV